MSSLTNVNNNSSVINVGRTTPVSPGPQPPERSIPVVVSNDTSLPIPVVEQQKIQSEVALSMLGIPRGEVALGIFSDVNTYDVNPSEWSSFPVEYSNGHGIKHSPGEAGAVIEAPKDEYAVLSSKRFFRYQPGRVSAATFGVKNSTVDQIDASGDLIGNDLNPSIRKYGIFDNFDGYYWESRGDGKGDNFATVRRTQSLIKNNPLEFSTETGGQIFDYRVVGKQADDSTDEPNAEPNAISLIQESRFTLIDDAFTDAASGNAYLTGISDANKEKCLRDMNFAIDAYVYDLRYGGKGHTLTHATTYRTALLTTQDERDAEALVHGELRDKITTLLNNAAFTTLNGENYDDRIFDLAQIVIDAVGGTQPSSTDLESTSATIWPRNKILTIFSIYKRYLGYLVSSSFTGGGANYTDEIKYKCLRDVGYIVDGYARDLAYGGNSATVYNMQNFYFQGLGSANNLQVTTFFDGYTQDEAGVIDFHVDAHTLVKQMISKTGELDSGDIPSGSWTFTSKLETGWESVFTHFALEEYKTRFDTELADPTIQNFDPATKYTGRMEFGRGSQFGDLVTFRDGLVHVHAAAFDPSLIKKVDPVSIKVNTTDDTIEVAHGEFVVGQHVEIIVGEGGTAPSPLVDKKVYKVKTVMGARSNILTLVDPTDDSDITLTSTGSDVFINPHVPFIFPKEYFEGRNPDDSPSLPENYTKYDGLFPYMYRKPGVGEEDGDLEGDGSPVGFINTTYSLSGSGADVRLAALKSEIDAVNYAYNNWIKQNVDPKFYAVYEYRVPRSRFSTDKLDGKERNVVYSDTATGTVEGVAGVRVQPGQRVESNGADLKETSVWDLDPEKVSMLKIEFSWYGAVGALFLAYVPVGNGEARWVRVHHMRASNQLKVASLGNATLPISYLVYGGGSENKLGIEDTKIKGYGSTSNNVVKYGASYYIDGGDRGTVRLYSHTNNNNTNVYGRKFTANLTGTAPQSGDDGEDLGYFVKLKVVGEDENVIPDDKTYFMKAQVITSDPQDQNVYVQWIDQTDPNNVKYYLNKTLRSTSGIKLIAQRPSIMFGLKAKENILNSNGFGIRNRVQVYPTKLATANFGNTPLKLDILKTPLFQPNIETSTSGFSLTEQQVITPDNNPLSTSLLGVYSAPSNLDYLENDGDYVYGWFKARIGSSSGTVFGRLMRNNGGLYYFTLLEVFSEPVTLYSGIDFLKDGRFTFNGEDITDDTLDTDTEVQKERLSSVFVTNTTQVPIPQTGTSVTSFFLKPGSDQFDLLSYFDYNKDYLSYPLTNVVESVYLAASSTGDFDANTSIEVNGSMTWEEQ